MAALVLWRPAADRVRAASLLARFGDAKAAAPAGLREEAFGGLPGRARLYVPSGPRRGAIVLVPGVHRLGIDEPRLVRFARALTTAGVVVLTAEVRALVDYRVEDAAPEDVGEAARALRGAVGHPVGVMGMSFAGGVALVAAGDPRYRDDVAFVVAVGAHDDLGRVARFFLENEIARPDGTTMHLAAHPYGPLVLIYDHAADFFPGPDLAGAREALKLWLWEEKDAAEGRLASLSPATASELRELFDGHLDAVRAQLAREIDTHQDAMRAVSPAARMAGLRAPVFLLHGAGDSVIPATETLWLAKDVPRGLLRDVLVSPALVHVELQGEPGWRDDWALVSFMADVLGAAQVTGI